MDKERILWVVLFVYVFLLVCWMCTPNYVLCFLPVGVFTGGQEEEEERHL